MIKLLSIIGISLVTFAATAQTFKITENSTGTDVTGKKVLLTVNDSSPNAILFTVTSPTNEGRSVKVKRNIITPLDGTTNALCWAGQCYPNEVDISPDAVDFARTKIGEFTADFNPLGDNDIKHTGTFAVRYAFFDEGRTDSTFFILQFEVGKNAGVKNNSKPVATLSEVYPNPAVTKAELKYKFDGNYSIVAKVYNLLGSEVSTQTITTKEGILSLPVTQLENGLYFLSIIAENKALTTRKFTVSH